MTDITVVKSISAMHGKQTPFASVLSNAKLQSTNLWPLGLTFHPSDISDPDSLVKVSLEESL